MKSVPIPFKCPQCDKVATILEISATAEATLEVYGLCVLCGMDFTIQYSMVRIIGACAVIEAQPQTLEERFRVILEDFKPEGKAN